MSDRFPPVSPATLTPEQKPIHDFLVDRILLHFQDTFTTRDKNGALVGLFTQFLYLPLSVRLGSTSGLHMNFTVIVESQSKRGYPITKFEIS
ncbi:hypothetical protein TWF191_005288 [Orbilia oligospora]|uniref:Uncharacterized protein n=1 Tax=Orbilia oligospora TaxID=2813651 RepID=A0A7C8QV14_ORBOL|nr:hypothetical protein TWF191_005288 [Orbilia oligospora]